MIVASSESALPVDLVPGGSTCVQAVRSALELGYRHIDAARAYGNEASLGRALRDSAIARDDVFIKTRFHPGRRDRLREAAYSVDLGASRSGG